MRPQPAGYNEERFGKDFLTDIINWIAENLTPLDIWNDDEIKEWLSDYAGDYGYVEEGSE